MTNPSDKVTQQVGIYHAPLEGDTEFFRVGGFKIDPATGHAVLDITDDRFSRELNHLAAGVIPSPISMHRMVMPSEGAAFLQALIKHLARTSYWRVVDESLGDA